MSSSSAPAILVLKFGSSVLRSEEDLPVAVAEIERFRREGRPIVAVVSAIGNTTDALLATARRISVDPEPYALALMVATGEDVAAAFLTMALGRAAMPVALMEPVAIGLRVEGRPLDSDPAALDVGCVRRALEDGSVGVVPGFYGRGPEGKIQLLGRGGSDLTAFHLARWLGADCRLLKNVDGVYADDPARLDRAGTRYEELTYDDALRLEGRVIQRKALLFAQRHRIVFEVAAPGGRVATRIGTDRTVPASPTAPGLDFTSQST